MNILLIEAQKTDNFTSKVYPPLGLYYLKSYIEKYAGFKTGFSIISSDNLSIPDKTEKPDIVGISSVTANWRKAVELGREARGKLGSNIPIILGGCHISSLPESLPKAFDAAVTGEGERTFLEILNVLNKKGELKPSDYSRIRGIAFWDHENRAEDFPLAVKKVKKRDGSIIVNENIPFIKNLDEVPFPSRKIAGIGVTHIVTSRGCPYSCVYCATCLLWGKVRSHSPEYVVREINHLYKGFNVKEIILFDDNFMADKNRVKEISRLMKKEGLSGKINFICYGRTRSVKEDLLNDLVKMGVKEIYLGADSIQDSNILGSTDKKSFKRNQEAIDLCVKAGLKVNCSFVIGLPRQKPEDLDEILDFVESNRKKISVFQISPVNLFPGTPLWKYAVEKGKIPGEIGDWSKMEHYTHIQGFNPDNYIYLNEMMSIETFADYCKRFAEIA